MKIQRVTPENRAKVYALLRRAFPGSDYEANLVQALHAQDRPIHEWAAIHTHKVIAYLAFSRAYHGQEVCGLHLAPMAVAPDFQRQGVGSELLRFALRQEQIKSQTLFVLGAADFYRRFGFEPCSAPVCLFTKNNIHFLGLRVHPASNFTVGYEPEFKSIAGRGGTQRKKRR